MNMQMDLTRRHFLATAAVVALAGCSRAAARAKGMHYQVQPGDSLSSIAQRAGIPIAEVVAANNLRSRHLNPGQNLWLPGITALPQAATQAPAAAPAAIGSSIHLVKRQQWGAQQLRPNHDPMRGITSITLHHTSEIPGMMHRNDPDLVRAIQHFHQDHRNWADIGYHLLIGRDGRVYEGRPLNVQGAHVGGDKNRNNLGISVVGDFHHTMPNPTQLATVKAVLDQQRQLHRIAGNRVYGHRELGVTVCPGDQLFGWLTKYRSQS